MKAAHRRLVFRFALIALVFPVVAWMLVRAWQPGTFAQSAVGHLQAFTGLGGGEGLEMLGMTGLGLYFALLVLLTVDVRKRTQGVLLLVGSLLAVLVFQWAGLLVPHIDTTAAANWAAFGLGAAIAIGLEATTIVDFDRKKQLNPPPREFKRTRHAIFGLALVLVLGGLSYHLSLDTQAGLAALDVAASAALLGLLAEFLRFDASHTVMVVGPKGAGKSMFLIGMFLQLQDRYENRPLATAPQPTEDLRQLLLEEDRLDDGEGWPPDSNKRGERGIKDVGFEFVAGTIFPTRVRFAATDHAGEHLDDIATYIQNGDGSLADLTEKASIGTGDDEGAIALDAGTQASEQDAEEAGDDSDGGGGDVQASSFATSPHAVGKRLAAKVEEADNLFCLIDSDKLLHGDDRSLGLEHFDAIVRETEAEITLIATKSDLLLEEYTEGDELIQTHDEELIPQHPREYQHFQDFATEHLRSNGVMVDTLMRDAQTGNVIPVYFKTNRENGSFKPERENGDLEPVGFDQVYEEIEETLAA